MSARRTGGGHRRAGGMAGSWKLETATLNLGGGLPQGTAYITVGDQALRPFHQRSDGAEKGNQAEVFVWERYS